MIAGIRKAAGKTGLTPEPKQARQDEFEDAMGSNVEEEPSEKDMIKEMWSMMKDIKRDVSQAKTEARLASAAAESANVGVKEVKLKMTNIEATVKSLQDKDEKIEKEMKDMKASFMAKHKVHETGTPDKQGSDEDGERDLQVIVEGLIEAQDESDVIDQVKAVVDGLGASSKYTNIKTFADPSKIGVVQFKSIASKIGFLRKANCSDIKWTNGKEMRFKTNDTVQKRTSDKTLGMIKYHLHETKGIALKEICIKWKENCVEVKKKSVAWLGQDGAFMYEESINEIKEHVSISMEEWKEKRGFD